jgi:serine/threonine protein kinase
MEFGKVLAWDNNRQIGIDVVRSLFREMSHAVQDVHKSDICHMDISLENFLVDTQDIKDTEDKRLKIKICDFELSYSVMEYSEEYHKERGKPHYMAPEIRTPLLQRGKPGEGVYDPRMADIYSLGVCLYMLVMGMPLYDGLPNTKNKAFMVLWSEGVKALITQSNATLPGDTVTDLLDKMLNCWEDRITIDQVLGHKWFDNLAMDNSIRVNSDVAAALRSTE